VKKQRLHENNNSYWIKDNICNKTFNEAVKISALLLSDNRGLKTIIDVLEKKPSYLISKIMSYSKTEVHHLNPEILTFCTINVIVNQIKKDMNLSNTWKNQLIIRIKKILSDKNTLNSSIY